MYLKCYSCERLGLVEITCHVCMYQWSLVLGFLDMPCVYVSMESCVGFPGHATCVCINGVLCWVSWTAEQCVIIKMKVWPSKTPGHLLFTQYMKHYWYDINEIRWLWTLRQFLLIRNAFWNFISVPNYPGKLKQLTSSSKK